MKRGLRLWARLCERVLNRMGDAVFLPGCTRCGAASPFRARGVCRECWAGVRPWAPVHPLEVSGDVEWMACALEYGGRSRELILQFKFGPDGGNGALAAPLGGLLAATARARSIHLDVDLVTAVPSHRSRIRRRGFDAAHLLAAATARRLGLRRPRALLARQDRHAPRARGRGPAPVFRLRRGAPGRIRGRTVLLVDDVMTTGRTLTNCAHLLRSAGAGEIRALLLARTPLHAPL